MLAVASSAKIPARMWKIQYAVVYAVGMLSICGGCAVGDSHHNARQTCVGRCALVNSIVVGHNLAPL